MNSQLIFSLEAEEFVLNEMLEYFVSSSIHSEATFNSGSFNLKLNISKGIKVVLIDRQIKLIIPLSIEVHKLGIFSGVSAKGKMILSLNIQYSISESWALRTNTDVSDLKWLEYPCMITSLFTLSLKTITGLITSRIKKEVSHRVDDYIKTSIDIKSVLKYSIIKIKDKIKAYPLLNLSIHIDFKRIRLSPISNLNDRVSCYLLIDYLVFVKNDKLNENIIQELPQFLSEDIEKNDSELNLSMELDTDMLESFVSTLLVNSEYEIYSRQFIINNLTLTTEKDIISVFIDFSGEFEGQLTVNLHPELNKENGILKIIDLDIKVKTKNLILKSLIVLLKSKITNQMKTLLESDINSYLHIIQPRVDDYIKQELKNSGLESNIILKELCLRNFEIHNNGLNLQIYIKSSNQILLVDGKTILQEMIV